MLCCSSEQTKGLAGAGVGLEAARRQTRGRQTTLNDYTEQLDILDAVADGITAQDPTGGLVYANDAAARAMGFTSADELLSAPLAEIMSQFELVDENGEPFPIENLPGRLALQGMNSTETIVGFRRLDTGGLRFSVVKARPVFDDEGLVRLAVNIFQDITERRRAETEKEDLLRRAESARLEAEVSADNLWAIHKVTDVALSNLELDDLLQELLERIREALSVDTAAILLVRKDGNELSLRAASGLDERALERLRVPIGSGVTGTIASSRRPVTLADLVEGDADSNLFRNSGVRSLAGVPLALEGKVVGVLVMGSLTKRSFDQREVGLLQVVGDRIAFAIDRARAFAAEHRALQRSELAVERMGRLLSVTGALSQAATLSQVTKVIVDQGLAAMDASAGSLALMADTQDAIEIVDAIGYPAEAITQWRRIPLDARVPLAEAARKKELVLVSSAEELESEYQLSPTDRENANFAAIPLMSEGRALGALGLSFGKEADFSRVQRAFMLSLGQQCAQALERARLYEAAQIAHAEAELARERIAFLAEASEKLGSSLDYHETLSQVARLAVPRVSDWCVVEMVDDEARSNHLTVAHEDESKVELARRLRDRYPPDPDARTGAANVRRTGESEIYPEITDAMLQAQAKDGEHLELLRSLELRSAILAPLTARGRVFGVITFASSHPTRRYDPEDLVFAESLARRAAGAIDNARLFHETQESRERFAYLARTLQRSLLPQSVPAIPGIEAAVRYRPAAEGTQVGGDFYDLFATGPDEWAVAIGDVCGKGARAAALTGLARHTIRAVAAIQPEPSAILSRLNDAIMRESKDDRAPQFCTVAYARLRPHVGRAEMTVSSGGHPLPYILRTSGSVERAGAPGLLLGVFDDAEVTEHPVELGASDAVVFYTDGVTEGRRGDESFGEARLREVIESCLGLDAERIASRIEGAVMDFSPDKRFDDVAILVLRVTPVLQALPT